MLKLYPSLIRSIPLRIFRDVSPVIWTRFQSSYVDKSLPFTSPKWLVNKPKFMHLPEEEQRGVSVIPLKFDPKDSKLVENNAYLNDDEFRKNLNNALTLVHSNLLTGYTEFDVSNSNATWLRLREFLYQELSRYSHKSFSSSSTLTISSLLKPTNPKELVQHLLSVDQISADTWKSILQRQEFSTVDQYYFILKNYFSFIKEQEIIPQMTPSWSLVDRGLDISNPSEWFPEARKLKRTIIMHVGPTNSGKTYNALQKLKNCPRGYYAGPLRLLAREVYDRFQNEGIRCNLLTGEEVIEDLDAMGNPAGLTSGTVEMIPLNRDFDICVLDEVQMLSEKDRGWAWTNAILGVRAKEIHLCGEESVLPLMDKIVKLTGDTLVVNRYERLGKLEVEHQPLANGLKGLKSGDCVIAFSKKSILDLKLRIEKETNLKVAVVYGSLPPETRVKQAKLFNSGEYDILVASDAIGMGLNLSINRVVFTASYKFNGVEVVPLTFSNIKQIGGRAGRFKGKKADGSSKESIGHVTAIDEDILRDVRKGINAPIQYLEKAVVWPTDELVNDLLSYYPPGMKLTVLLNKFKTDILKSSTKSFELSYIDDKSKVVSTFEDMRGLTLKDKLRLSNAPVRINPMVMNIFKKFCETIAERRTMSLLNYPLPFLMLHSRHIKDENVSLEFYEEFHQLINLYCWLHIRYPNLFVDYESAIDIKNHCEMMIFKKLEFLKKNPYKKFNKRSQSKNSSPKNRYATKKSYRSNSY
ncbi:ATP-dependent RNA helicase SUV3 [Kluyveromyces lactis]|uniref:ATP-dependent RNA helicase SUV3, mitochondrial n=1 Tax=Kluyveromyces lactis (strain ATCC 8585 / CBS 2359 / DSM 70799 / NBRC 1267 / NRRL Y-1140 / WM37) TaxID=284590 RepID=Q6CR41_KLULA|nr:uncharacterized protein KLLA0_D12034g [Kluyveromyces lactis]CAH00694.1 KLLA0D12034p [Kluyveromyces lactis]|eukprot:XP_453598.1 uncharacterized protein KLLA0_D12034g [Kluyveromyces lactis]